MNHDTMISLQGRDVQIWRNTPGNVDPANYYEETPSWALVATERILIADTQNPRTASVVQSTLGRMDERDHLALFLSDTVVLKDDELRIGSLTYKVQLIYPIVLYGATTHNEGLVRHIEEGS